MSQALVFADQGVCLPSAKALKRQLKSLLDPSISVLKVNGAYLRTNQWEDKTVVLAMGGGLCSDWDERLQAEGIQKIQRYVKGGGKYIGICAGAYFASAESRFELTDRIIEKSRPLAFFPGKALGPLVGRDDYLSLKAARAAEVCFKIQGSPEHGVLYYQGGCLFDVVEDSAAVEIMSAYRGLGKAAAVFCKVGKGFAYLDGTHPEFIWPASLGKGADKVYNELVGKLSPQEVFRARVWKEIGAKLALPVGTINVSV